ncbi:proton-conducting transporter membrane subunit [Mycoplasmatota bacterium zrk1]
MFSIELVVLSTLLAGVLAYLVSIKLPKLGSYLTILASLAVFSVLAYFGFNNNLDAEVNLIPQFVLFKTSMFGLYFAIIVSFIFFMVSFFNPYFIKDYKYPAAYNLFYLMALAGTIGVFFASNFITLFIFFEIVVWTSMFLIPLGKKRKPTVTYFVFSTVGSFAMLYAIMFTFSITGSFDLAAISVLSGKSALLVYILLAVAGFAKLGAYPFYVWLPKVLGKSPDPVSAVFSGGIEKLGAFIAFMAILRISPASIYLEAVGMYLQNYVIAIFGAITIVVGTLQAIRQDDAKKLLAYSSASNGGYILVAIAMSSSISLTGAMYHILAHALASTAAFLAIAVVHYRTKTTKISELGGMIHHMPLTYMVYLMAIISMAGIPPMGGFISKWIIFQSVISKQMIIVAVATFFGSIGSFLYVFRPLAALFLGQKLPKYKGVKEAPFLMMIPLIILTLGSFYIGVIPNQVIDFSNKVIAEFGFGPLVMNEFGIQGANGTLSAPIIASVFGLGVVVIAIIFFILPKSRKVGLMDTYTSGEFIYTEELLHYSADFYAPFERLYPAKPLISKVYAMIKEKVNELGRFFKYWFFTNKPEVTVLWIVLILTLLVWGDIL